MSAPERFEVVTDQVTPESENIMQSLNSSIVLHPK